MSEMLRLRKQQPNRFSEATPFELLLTVYFAWFYMLFHRDFIFSNIHPGTRFIGYINNDTNYIMLVGVSQYVTVTKSWTKWVISLLTRMLLM